MSEDYAGIHRDLGRIEGRVEALESDFAGLKADFKESFDKIDKRLEKIDQGLENIKDDRTSLRASWKTLTVIATILVSLSGAGVWGFKQANALSDKIEKLTQQSISAPKQP